MEQQALIDGEKHGALVDLEDIETYFEEFGKGSHLLEYEFRPDTPNRVPYISKESGLERFFWSWTHKLTQHSVKRYSSANNKSNDLGRLSKYLASINERQHPVAYARAQKILQLNDSSGVVVPDAVASPLLPLTRSEVLEQQVWM